jgi:alpha-L-fucosidase 2
MLLQSDGQEVELLPALPTDWAHGTVTGLRARAGLTVDIYWTAGRLLRACLTADRTVQMRVRQGATVTAKTLRAHEPHWIEAAELQ